MGLVSIKIEWLSWGLEE